MTEKQPGQMQQTQGEEVIRKSLELIRKLKDHCR